MEYLSNQPVNMTSGHITLKLTNMWVSNTEIWSKTRFNKYDVRAVNVNYVCQISVAYQEHDSMCFTILSHLSQVSATCQSHDTHKLAKRQLENKLGASLCALFLEAFFKLSRSLLETYLKHTWIILEAYFFLCFGILLLFPRNYSHWYERVFSRDK